MTPYEFDSLAVGDTVVHVRTGRALVVTDVHTGDGRFLRPVVYAARRPGERRVAVIPEEFHRQTLRRLA